MALYTKVPNTLQEVDVIIVGGGTAGCVVASRLAEADPGLSILVIEGGQNNNDIPSIACPVYFMAHLAPDSTASIFHNANKSAAVGDRELAVPCGGVLGGGSSTNFMMYSRAQRLDFDSWQTHGWSAAELLPFLKKIENYDGPDEKNVHGRSGPVQISRGTYSATRVEAEFLESAKGLGWPEVEDLADLETVNAVWRARRYISPDGKRQDAATCYLHPTLQRGVSSANNLHVLVETQVTRVLFDASHRAVGVEFRPNPLFQQGLGGDSAQQIQTIKAKTLVVSACGAFGSPALLQRSGVGDAQVLSRAGVALVADLPGVGRDYEDHHLLLYGYTSDLGIEDTLDELLHKQGGSLADEVKARMMGWNAQDIQGKVRPAEDEIAALGPEFQEVWNKEYKPFPEKPLACFTLIGGFPGHPSQYPGKPCLALSAFTVYPLSRGHVYITGSRLEDPLDFESGFFVGKGELDIKKHVWLYKKQRELIRRMPSYRGEISPLHPPFPATSSAACVSLDAPLGPDASNIEYTAEDDAILEKWIRENIGTTWHSLGTCKMRSQDDLGVVNPSLNVYGVTGLKIADMSIVPSNVAANTNDTALLIGEKAADICIRELGLGQQ